MAIHFCQTAGQLQTAFDTCNAGDVIRLDRTMPPFEKDFTVQNRGVIPDSNRIIVESDTPVGSLPADGYRIFPSYSNVLAKIQPNQHPSMQFAPGLRFAQGANGYTFRNLEFLNNPFGSGIIIEIGGNDSQQTQYSHIPYNITFDRCYVHGHPISGQKGGIRICGDNVRIINCYVDEIWGFGQDSSAMGILNCRGPVYIENCNIEAAAENFITGGSDPEIRTLATVLSSPAPTTTAMTLSTVTDLTIGQHMAIQYMDGATLRRAYAKATAINGITNRVTMTAIPQPPHIPGSVQWGVQLDGFTFRRNHVRKPPSWMTPILATPTPTLSLVAGTGLSAGTYYVRVQARHDTIGYQQNWYYSIPSAEQSFVVTTTGRIQGSWTFPGNVDRHIWYRYQKDGSGNLINGMSYVVNTASFTDSNQAGGTSFTFFPGASYRQEKNLFELKTGINCQIDSNIFEYQWLSSAGDGYAIWLKNNNQDLAHAFSQCEDVVFENNVIRHCCGFMSISDQRATGELPKDLPDHMRDIMIRQNLIYDCGSAWRAANANVGSCYAMQTFGGPPNVTWEHNTVLHPDSSGTDQLGTEPANQGYQLNEIWRSNIFIRGFFGFFATIPPLFGLQHKNAIDNITNFTATFNRNIVADGEASYNTFASSTNYIPTLASLQNEFKAYGGANPQDYKLKRIAEGDAFDSAFINQGHDAEDVGCDVDLILAAIAGVVEGYPDGTPPPPGPGPAPPTVDQRLYAGRVKPGLLRRV